MPITFKFKSDMSDLISHLRILKGGAALSPDDMVRARFSAVRSKDAVFMAKTEEWWARSYRSYSSG